ncbi:MAG TPA: oxygenase MpaB family protein [Candidatus Micrarchaeia archaeon]|nr:oxygenase MpaB family protein [Candidatus Micrarchaeia archaeon]
MPHGLRDRAPDPGLFGPGSVTWRVLAEPVVGLGASRALLMQTAHPLVAQGALDHSTFAQDPTGRFERTVGWVTRVVFGTTAEARSACRVVNRRHAGVVGSVPGHHATERVAAGTPYSARDPSLLRWVHAVLLETLIVSHDAFVGGLTEPDRDRMVAEWDGVARLIGLGPGPIWSGWTALETEIALAVVDGPARPGRAAREVAATILAPPDPRAPARARALRPVAGFLVTGLLPGPIRHGYGLRWGPLQAAAHAAACAGLRRTSGSLPAALRGSPAHRFARDRLAGRLKRPQDRSPRRAGAAPG